MQNIILKSHEAIENPKKEDVSKSLSDLLNKKIDHICLQSSRKQILVTVKNQMFSVDIYGDKGGFRSREKYFYSEIKENIWDFLEKPIDEEHFKNIRPAFNIMEGGFLFFLGVMALWKFSYWRDIFFIWGLFIFLFFLVKFYLNIEDTILYRCRKNHRTFLFGLKILLRSVLVFMFVLVPVSVLYLFFHFDLFLEGHSYLSKFLRSLHS